MGHTEPATATSKPLTAFKALLGLAIAYGFGSRAIDTGSIWQYGLSLGALALSLKLIVRIFQK